MKLLHQSGEIIAQRYRILDTLGQGGVGTTYEAQDLQNGQRVTLKALSLHRMSDWKKMELFEREARILSQLNHPAIPHYLDYFQVDTPQDRSFYIVQQLAIGKSLAALVESGWHPREVEVQRLAIQVLEILVYLQELTPSIIHRDIKPKNIIRSEEGQVFLVDFGAVQDTYHHTVSGGSTVVGTYGYMAPEQFRGQAVLSTDLYGLGATLLFLLVGKSPADLPQHQLKMNFRSHVRVSKTFADWLEKMLEPVIENRFPCAKAALAVLQGEQPLTNYSTKRFSQPKHSPITLTQAEGQLVINIPPVWLRTNRSLLFAILPLLWNGILLPSLWVYGEMLSSVYSVKEALLTKGVEGLRFVSNTFLETITWRLSELLCRDNCWLSMVFVWNAPLWLLDILHEFFDEGLLVFGLIGLWMLVTFLLSAASRIRLEINQDSFCLQRQFLGWRYKKVQRDTKDISQAKMSCISLPLMKKLLTFCVLRSKRKKYRFGFFLTPLEKKWLVGEINACVEKIRENSLSPSD